MSEPENFIARWSRRKAAAQDAARPVAAPDNGGTPADDGEGDRKASDAAPALDGAPEPSAAAFDPTTLPPIESITAESDISAFLAPGVPAELTRAALRRAWAVDPKIRDFVGLAENAWDFNTPGAIPGFGALEMTDELRRHIAQLVNRDLREPSSPQSSSAAEAQEDRATVEVS